MSEVLEPFTLDMKKLPRDLTPSERVVAEISIDLARGRDDHTVDLTEITKLFLERTNRKHKNARTTVNHFVKNVCLKTVGAPELGYRLISRGNLGRGNIAEFTWIKHNFEYND